MRIDLQIQASDPFEIGESDDRPSLPTGLRFVEIPDDHLESTLRRRDYVLLDPVEAFAGEGIYIVRNALGGLASFRVDASLKRGDPQLRLWCENQHYSKRYLSTASFRDVVVGKAVMICRVVDSRLHHCHPVAA